MGVDTDTMTAPAASTVAASSEAVKTVQDSEHMIFRLAVTLIRRTVGKGVTVTKLAFCNPSV